MRSVWRISGPAIALIVLVRISIGWQFLYEGLWKLNTFKTAKPWTSAGYLRGARGPFRDLFRNMTGDPDEMSWSDYDRVIARFDDWKSRFLNHYSDLSDDQRRKLNELVEGVDQFTAPLDALPPGFKFSKGLEGTIWHDADAKLLVVDGKRHLLAKERNEVVKQITDKKLDGSKEGKKFLAALDRVAKDSSVLGYKERVLGLLKGDPERVGQIYRDDKTNEILEERQGKVAQYQAALERYERNSRNARQAFQHDHLQTDAELVQKLRGELAGPVKALYEQMKHQGQKLLNENQLHGVGALTEKPSQQSLIDHATIWGLILLGILLIVGLMSRLAAVGAAVMLLSFYLVVPPWPGVLELIETAGPEHSFIVNKNSIEIVALLAIALMPTGQWFGLDRIVWWMFRGRKTANTRAKVS